MVSVFFGIDHKVVKNVDRYFNNVYTPEWLKDPLVKEMIEDIDKTKVLSPHCLESPVLGQIAPERLSGGVKTCIMLYKLDTFYPDLIACGPNCEPWLSEVFKRKCLVRVAMGGVDLTFKGLEIKGICENDGSKINNSEDWVMKMLEIGGEFHER